MAQNERQGVGTEKGGTAGSKTGSENAGAYAATQSPAPAATGTGGEQGRIEPASPGTAGTREQGGRLARREGWDDPFTSFFGGSPFALFRRLSDDMDRLFFGGSTGQGLGAFGGFTGRFLPHIEVEERDDKLVVRADLPGVRPEDFRVDIEDDSLVLKGERRMQQEENRGGMRRSERVYGSFRRVIPLPPGANPEGADARFENGVLEIDIPVQQQSRTRHLEVRSGGTTSTGTDTGGDTTKH